MSVSVEPGSSPVPKDIIEPQDTPAVLQANKETTAVSEIKEITKEVRRQEIQTITNTILSRIWNETPADQYESVQSEAINGYLLFTANDRPLKGAPLSTEGTPLQITLDGTKGYVAVETGGLNILSLNSKVVEENGQAYFMCKVDGMSEDVKVPAQELARAQLFTEGTKILDSITDPQKKEFLKTVFDSQRNADTEIKMNDQTIQLAAEHALLFSHNIGEDYVLKSTKDNPALQEKLLKGIEGKNILTPDDVIGLINQTNDLADRIDNIADQVSSGKTLLELKEAQLKKAPDNKILQDEVKTLKDQVDILTVEQEMLKKLEETIANTPLFDTIQDLYNGKGDLAQAKTLQRAMGKGDMVQMYKTMIEDIKDPSKKAYFEKVGKLAAQAGGGILLLIFIAMMEATKQQ